MLLDGLKPSTSSKNEDISPGKLHGLPELLR